MVIGEFLTTMTMYPFAFSLLCRLSPVASSYVELSTHTTQADVTRDTAHSTHTTPHKSQ